MSKYYKAEDVIRKRAEDLADTSYWEYGNEKNVDEWIEVAEMEFASLPTIEVSEDCISRLETLELLNVMMAVDSINSKVYAKVFSQIKDAPSVVPQVPSEDCNTCYFEGCEPGQEPCIYCFVNNSKWKPKTEQFSICPNCGAKMKGAEE